MYKIILNIYLIYYMEEESLNILNIPILQSTILIPQSHKMFADYTTNSNYDYAINLFKSLCLNSNSKNQPSLFFKCMKIYIKVLYNAKNINFFSGDFDLFLLTCFYLGMKTNETKRRVPKLKKLIEILPEFNNFDTYNIKLAEIICVKLLNYDINMTTAYDYIYHLSNNNKPLLELAICELEKIMKEQPRNFILKAPMDLAKYSIGNAKQNNYFNNYVHLRLNSTISNFYNKNIKKYKTISAQKNNSVENLENSAKMNRISKKSGGLYDCSYNLYKKFNQAINFSVGNMSNIMNSKSDCYIKKIINDYKKPEKENFDKEKMCKLIKEDCSGDNIKKIKKYVQGVNYYYSSIKKRNMDINRLKRAK